MRVLTGTQNNQFHREKTAVKRVKRQLMLSPCLSQRMLEYTTQKMRTTAAQKKFLQFLNKFLRKICHSGDQMENQSGTDPNGYVLRRKKRDILKKPETFCKDLPRRGIS